LAEAEALLDPADDAPDMTSPEWRARFHDALSKRRGRPAAAQTKVPTTLRLDPDVLAAFKSGGPGWQRRMNDALRAAAGLPEKGRG
jgi:uncharacterized protein (DUF4415 family)